MCVLPFFYHWQRENINSNLCVLLFSGYPGYGYFPGAANGIGGGAGAVNGIGGGGGSGGGGGGAIVNGVGGNNPGGADRNGSSQPSPATFYDYTNGGAAAAAAAAAAYHHRAGHVDPATAMGNSPLLRDAYTGRSGSFTFFFFLLLVHKYIYNPSCLDDHHPSSSDLAHSHSPFSAVVSV